MTFPLLKEKKLILVCGSGGVGKTTLAAALALKGAEDGKKVVVLTIDPAKRLATSLGLDSLTGDAKKISADLIENATGIRDAALHAMMLDSKRTFDRLVEKYAPSREKREKILNNKIYQHLSNMISGSQEYMAMEKLYEIVQEEAFDLIVVDTPPTTHAIDFLEAPQKMISALSNSMIHLLLKPALLAGKSGLKLFEKGSRLILKAFDRIAGFAFLQDISEMLLSFQEMLGGFEQRAKEVNTILTGPETSFILVTACEAKSIEEAKIFSDRLTEREFPLGGIILNRVHPFYKKSEEQKSGDLAMLGERVGDELGQKMVQAFENFEPLARQDRKYRQEMKDLFKPDQFLVSIPLFESDIHDLAGLHRLSGYLE